jgi:FKBP-type peptidyl-prolyl cis-trans isomerase 2
MKTLITRAVVFALLAGLISGCAGGNKAKDGDTVKVEYTGRLDDGTIFDSSEGREPLEFAIGSGNIIAGFEKGVIGMGIGESKTITIPVEEAYGPSRPELIFTVSKGEFPEDMEFEAGMELQSQQPDGRIMRATVLEIMDDSVTVDMNHPLAGKTLIFDIELVEII